MPAPRARRRILACGLTLVVLALVPGPGAGVVAWPHHTAADEKPAHEEPACQQAESHPSAPLPTFEETPRWVERFERPEREASQKPDEVVAALHLRPGDTVADVGAGSGYFTFRLARAVGPEGRVLAVDIEEGMLAYIRERSAREDGGQVVETILAAEDDPHLPDGAVDLVLMVNTYHHLQDRVAYLQRLRGDLAAEGGRIAVVDYFKRELPMGPPPSHKLSREEVVAEFEQAGLHLVGEETFLPYQYFLIFSP